MSSWIYILININVSYTMYSVHLLTECLCAAGTSEGKNIQQFVIEKNVITTSPLKSLGECK